jgi:hypothetical protein
MKEGRRSGRIGGRERTLEIGESIDESKYSISWESRGSQE